MNQPATSGVWMTPTAPPVDAEEQFYPDGRWMDPGCYVRVAMDADLPTIPGPACPYCHGLTDRQGEAYGRVVQALQDGRALVDPVPVGAVCACLACRQVFVLGGLE